MLLARRRRRGDEQRRGDHAAAAVDAPPGQRGATSHGGSRSWRGQGPASRQWTMGARTRSRGGATSRGGLEGQQAGGARGRWLTNRRRAAGARIQGMRRRLPWRYHEFSRYTNERERGIQGNERDVGGQRLRDRGICVRLCWWPGGLVRGLGHI